MTASHTLGSKKPGSVLDAIHPGDLERRKSELEFGRHCDVLRTSAEGGRIGCRDRCRRLVQSPERELSVEGADNDVKFGGCEIRH